MGEFQTCRRDKVGQLKPLNLIAFAYLLTTAAMAQERLPTIPPDQYTDAQKKAAEDFLAARKVPVFGPFEPLMYSPEVMSQARAMGDYLRYKSRIGTTLSEIVILVTARGWTQDYEWYVHAPIAAKAGIKPEIIEAIRDGRRPTGMSEDEEIVYDFSTERTRTSACRMRRLHGPRRGLASQRWSIWWRSTATTRSWPCS
jgi:4-carboxymuconolactone decarboxylase